MVSARETFFAYAVAARNVARVLGRAYAVDGGLAAYEDGQAREVC